MIDYEQQEFDKCPWFHIERMVNDCSCKEYKSKKDVHRTLVLIDNSCPTHGCSKKVDEFNQEADTVNS